MAGHPGITSVNITRSNITEDQSIVILAGLVGNNSGIAATRRSELVFSNIGDSSRQVEEESLNGNDINCIDRCIAIDIGCR